MKLYLKVEVWRTATYLYRHLHARVCECVYSYPRQQALWWCRGHSFSVWPLGRAQLGRHGGRFVNIGQRLGAILRLDILCPVRLVAICVVVKVWGDRGRES